jgi:hypothetical protein
LLTLLSRKPNDLLGRRSVWPRLWVWKFGFIVGEAWDTQDR